MPLLVPANLETSERDYHEKFEQNQFSPRGSASKKRAFVRGGLDSSYRTPMSDSPFDGTSRAIEDQSTEDEAEDYVPSQEGSSHSHFFFFVLVSFFV